MPLRRAKGIFCLSLLVFGIPLGLSGQKNYVVEHLDITESLPSLGVGVHGIAQDKRGIIWIAANEGGLIRYDGSTYKVINQSPGSKPRLVNSFVRDVLADDSGNIWVAHDLGIEVLNPVSLELVKKIPIPSTNALFKTQVRSLCKGQDGDIWAAAQYAGVIRIPNGDPTKIQTFPNILLPDYINQASNGSLWCISRFDTPYLWHKDHFEQHIYKGGFTPPLVGSIMLPIEDENGYVAGFWRVHNNGQSEAFRIDPGSSRLQPGMPETGITPFLSREISDIMLPFTSPMSKAPLLHHPLKTMKDVQGITWIAPGAGGIFKLKPAEMKFTTCPELQGVSLRGMLETKDGIVYITTYDGIFEYSISNNKAKRLSRPGEELFYHFGQCRNDTLVVFSENTNFGDFILGNPGRYKLHPAGIPDIGACFLSSFPIGNGWILVGNQEIFRLRPSDWRIEPFCKLPTDPTTRTIIYRAGKNGKIWLGTTDGVFQIDTAGNCTAPAIRQKSGLGSGSQVNDIYEDESGKYWFATRRNGLICYNPATDSIRLYDSNNGFANNETYAISGSHHDDLIWVSTYAGLQCLSQTSGKISLFTETDGTAGTEFNTRSYLKLSNGEVLMGGVKGLTRFSPLDYHPQQNNTPLPFITDIQVVDFASNDTLLINYPPNDTFYTFSPSQNTIQFQFGCNSYFYSDAYTYYIQLEGIDHDWVPLGHVSNIKYYHLIPGTYKFKVRLIVNNDSRKTNDFSIAFTIDQVYYKKWWFITILCLLALSTAILIMWSIRQRHYREEKIRRAIAKDLHSMLGGKLSQISNMLHVLKQLKANNQPIEKEIQYLTEFTRRAHGNLSDVIWVLAQKEDMSGGLVSRMEDYIDKWLRSAKIKVEFEQNMSGNEAQIPISVQHQLLLVFSEALSNIIKHTYSDDVKIRFLQQDDKSITLSVVNHFQHRKINPPSSGQGLTIIRELVGKIGGVLETNLFEDHFSLSVRFAIGLVKTLK